MAYQEDSYYIDQIVRFGEKSAFAELINKHKTRVFNIAFRITKNREDAEEVAQDTFIKVYHNLAGFRGDSLFSTWLFKVAYHLGLSKIRKKSLFTGSIDDDNFNESSPQNGFETGDRFHEKDRRHHLQNAISKLDEQDQLLIALYYNDDLPVEEISQITDLSASNVKVRLFRARKKLGELLSEHLKDEVESIL